MISVVLSTMWALVGAILLTIAPILLPVTVAQADVIDEIPPGQWYEVPNSHMEDVKPPSNLRPSSAGTSVECVMDCWSGGAFDTQRNILYVWGGGHGQYSGNELYGFDVDKLQWERITDPSINVGGSEASGIYPDGKPRSRHTYNALQYADSVGKLFAMGGSAYYPGGQVSNKAVNAFSMNSRNWNTGLSKLPMDGDIRGGVSAYDPATGKIWSVLGFTSKLAAYDPRNDSWSAQYGSSWLPYYTTAAIDPERRLMVAVGKGELIVWDLSNPGNPSNPSSSGNTAIQNTASPGFAFDPVTKLFVGWDGGASVYTLDPDNWSWNRVAPASGNSVTPTSANSNGTFGRFRYVPSKNVFIAVNRVDENVYLYRLSSGQGIPPQMIDGTPPSPPKDVLAN